MIDTALYAYAAAIIIYRVVEGAIMRRTGSFSRRPKQDWTMGLIAVPYYLVMVGPLLEYLYFEWRPQPIHVGLGAVCLAAATVLRAKGHLDLGSGFSMAIERAAGSELVETGLYATIRHPLYLGNVALFVGCPLFLAARLSWVFTVLGFVGVLVRIQIEERFLMEQLEGYEAYRERTWALIPGIY